MVRLAVLFRFNSRTPGGVRLTTEFSSSGGKRFQFTHPGRGATQLDKLLKEGKLRFNSRTPGGVRRPFGLLPIGVRYVSIHAPREGCDQLLVHLPHRLVLFQFTHPGRGATPSQVRSLLHQQSFNSRTPGGVRHRTTLRHDLPRAVSIHAPREGCDRAVCLSSSLRMAFQFTHPGRGATELLD